MPLTFARDTHAYALDDAPVRSVTQILHVVGLNDFRHVPPAILDAARTRGTVVHQAVHYYNEHDLDVAEFGATFPEYAGYLASWRQLADSGRLTTCLCEHRVASTTPRYAGTFDWLGLFDGAPTLLDFATGAPEDVAKHLQTAAYVLAARAWAAQPGEQILADFMTTNPYIARFAVRLDRDGRMPALTPYRDPRDLAKFSLLAMAVNTADAERGTLTPWTWIDDEPRVA